MCSLPVYTDAVEIFDQSLQAQTTAQLPQRL